MQQKIIEKLTSAFLPDHLDVINESPRHQVPKGSESHFKVTLVTSKFNEISKVKRHQWVYAELAEEMKFIHALSLHTYNPAEWEKMTTAPTSPPCLGKRKEKL